MRVREVLVDELTAARLVLPDHRPVGGVLVLAGSSGRVDVDRASLFARAGFAAVAMRWFGGPGQPPGICEVPLETFTPALDVLAEHAPDLLVIVGTSKGAEAALALAVRDPRVDAVIGFAPSSVVWANVGPGFDGAMRPQRSSWTWRGESLPFVAYGEAAWPRILRFLG